MGGGEGAVTVAGAGGEGGGGRSGREGRSIARSSPQAGSLARTQRTRPKEEVMAQPVWTNGRLLESQVQSTSVPQIQLFARFTKIDRCLVAVLFEQVQKVRPCE